MIRHAAWSIMGLLAAVLTPKMAWAVPITADKPIAFPGSPGGFDYIQVDATLHRLIAAHKKTQGLAILDLKTGQPLPELRIGTAQGVAVDPKGGRYFVGDEDEKKVVVVDATTLTVTGEIPVPGPVDAIAFDSKRGLVFADEDNGTHVWVIDPSAKKIVATIVIPGEPEYLDYDPVTDRVYQNIKNKDAVVVINPATNRIDATWPTAPATSPHGLAIDSPKGQLFVAGGNGKLVGFDLKTGRLFASADIAKNVDQISYDPALQTVYCAGKGQVSAVKITGTAVRVLSSSPSPKGAHTLAVDPATHDVWLVYADTKHSYAQRLKSAQ